MELTGGCQCGAVRYRVSGVPVHVALCHCSDCRKSSGAPMLSWAAFASDGLEIKQGEVTWFNSSGNSMRSFCPTCGTGLFFRNEEMMPGIIDVQSATLENPDVLPPTAQIQTAERIGWMATAHELPAFARYPGMD